MMRLLKFVPSDSKFDFLKLRKLTLCISMLFIAASIAMFAVRGLNLGIDFAGGVLIEAELNQVEPLGELRQELAQLPVSDVMIQEFGEPHILLIRFVPDATQITPQEGISLAKDALSSKVDTFRRTEMVGPTIGSELKVQSAQAIGLALLLLMLYIWFRFEWQFGVGAVLALTHDIFIIIGFYALTGIEFNLSSIAALLTVAGYSINDTVVIFDRVREDIRRFKSTPFIEILNFAINRTLARTVMTSLTTLTALISLAVFGGSIIQDFALALIVGVIVGTYSSVFLAVLFLLYAEPKRSEMDNDG